MVQWSEQWFRKSPLLCKKIWSHTPSASGSYSRESGRHSDAILLDLKIFKILYGSHW